MQLNSSVSKTVNNEEAISKGEAAQQLLNNPVVQSFFRNYSMDMYSDFVECSNSDPEKGLAIMYKQKCLQELIGHLQTLVVDMNRVLSKRGIESKKDSTTIREQERLRLLGAL